MISYLYFSGEMIYDGKINTLPSKTKLMVKNFKIDSVTICGDTLCIDFINTVKDRVSDPLKDYLDNFEDLLYWAKRVEIIDTSLYQKLLLHATKDPNKATSFFNEAIAFRELLYQMFYEIVKTENVSQTHLDSYNKILMEYFAVKKIVNLKNDLVASWDLEADNFKNILVGIVEDSYYLLLSTDKLKKVKECPKCHWLFLDTTKNGRRRWCTMKTCGASVKALEWYHRNKS
jgi:predicted RNA-binding Zn ribbon-like protein